MLVNLSKILINLDCFFDYIPPVSTVTNTLAITTKAFFPRTLKASANNKAYFYSHIKEKHLLRCVILLIPGLGNLTIFLYDLTKWISSCLNKQSIKTPKKNTIKITPQKRIKNNTKPTNPLTNPPPVKKPASTSDHNQSSLFPPDKPPKETNYQASTDSSIRQEDPHPIPISDHNQISLFPSDKPPKSSSKSPNPSSDNNHPYSDNNHPSLRAKCYDGLFDFYADLGFQEKIKTCPQ